MLWLGGGGRLYPTGDEQNKTFYQTEIYFVLKIVMWRWEGKGGNFLFQII